MWILRFPKTFQRKFDDMEGGIPVVYWTIFHPDYPEMIIAHGMCMRLNPMIDLAKEQIEAICREHFRCNRGCDVLKAKIRITYPNNSFAEWIFDHQRNTKAA